MRILIAPDAFKGSLTSPQAAAAMVSGIRSSLPDADIVSMPLADGGEGTLDVLQGRCGGKMRNGIFYFNDNGVPCALIESARLIGLTLPDMQVDVFGRGSAKLGAAILSALGAGVQDIRVALGGSATVDGGLGLLTALGCRVLHHGGEAVSPDLNGMMQAEQIDPGGLDPRLRHTRITILSDVQNPLGGSQGAVYLYGSQKGIVNDRLAEVEMAMRRWGDLCERAFGVSVNNDAGAGAAGGLGFALTLMGSQLVSGAEYVMNACGFDQVVKTVNWVVTGEGRSDVQTLHGKLAAVVAGRARNYGVKTALISGAVDCTEDMQRIFDMVVVATPSGYGHNMAMSDAGKLLRQASAMWADAILAVVNQSESVTV